MPAGTAVPIRISVDNLTVSESYGNHDLITIKKVILVNIHLHRHEVKKHNAFRKNFFQVRELVGQNKAGAGNCFIRY